MPQTPDQVMFDYQLPENLSDAFSKQDSAYVNSCYEIIACMVMQLDSIFRTHHDVQSVQFFSSTDPREGPILMCLDTVGEDVSYMDSIEEIVDQWGVSLHHGARLFMELSDTQKLRRSHLVADRNQWIQLLGESLPFQEGLNTQWAQTLDSALKARDLRDIADKIKPDRPKNKTPGL